MFSPSDTAEPSPMIRLERHRLTAPDGRTWTSHITATGITATTNS